MRPPFTGPGIVATPADWQLREIGFWPPQAEGRHPTWHAEHIGDTCYVSMLHTGTTGRLAQALGNWGRVVPAGRP
jgi:hypothetical protein